MTDKDRLVANIKSMTKEQMQEFLAIARFGVPLLQAGEDASTVLAKWEERKKNICPKTSIDKG